MDNEKAIRAAKLTLGGIIEKRRAKTAVERAQGQIAPSKYLPDVPRQVHANGGYVPMASLPIPKLAVATPLEFGQQPGVLDVLGTLNKVAGSARSISDLVRPEKEKTPHAARAEAKAEGLTPEASAAMEALRKGWTGADFGIVSGYRSPEENRAAKGAKDSQHIHGNAYDVNTTGWSPEEKLALADAAWNAGFRGFGFYDNNMHFDVAGPRAWGPSYSRDSIPDWAQGWAQERYGYNRGGPVMTEKELIDQMPAPEDGAERLQGALDDVSRAGTIGSRLGKLTGIPIVGSLIGRNLAEQAAMSKYAEGGEVTDLGQAREQKQMQTYHTGMMDDIHQRMMNAMDAHEKAVGQGVFDGYEVGDTLQGSAHPMRITGRYMQKWKPTTMALRSFERMGTQPTIIEHEGEQYIPMLRYETGKEGVDGFQQGSAYLDGVKAAGYQKMGGLRAVKARGGSVGFDKWFEGSKVRHPDGRPMQMVHATQSADIKAFRPSNEGIWFSPKHDTTSADEVATIDHAQKGYINSTDPDREPSFARDATYYPVHLSIKNPAMGNLADDFYSGKETVKSLKRKGYDGVKYHDDVHVVFEPNQIKSVFNRSAHTDDPDILKADGGSVNAKESFLAGNHPDVPDVLYHGNAPRVATKGWMEEVDEEQTQKNRDAMDFKEFKPSGHGKYGSGIYLTDNPAAASGYAQGIRADQRNPKMYGQVMKLHASIKQPFTEETLRIPAWRDYIKNALSDYISPHRKEDLAHRQMLFQKLDDGTATLNDLFLREVPEGHLINDWGQYDIHDTIRRSGFDGIIAKSPAGVKEYVAFKPEQVKSALSARKFDPTSPDMTYADGGAVGMGDDEVPQAPGQSPIPEDHVRLYHQTSVENIPSIMQGGLMFAHAKGYEGPKAIYADEKGFYGKPGQVPTIEFSVHKDRWRYPPFVQGDVDPKSIIAAHLPWHGTARYIEEDDRLLKDVLSGEHDHLLDDQGSNEARAINYIKKKYAAAKADGGAVPQKTVKAYKLFRTKGDGKLYPLFVNADKPVPMGEWLEAEEGPQGKSEGKVKSKLGDLAYRPGWHAGDLPMATHIGGKSDPSLKKPDYRPDNHVWAEVEMAADKDWQSVADSRGKGVKAHITDQVPYGGFYRYKTNPNMTGNWLIGGNMKVNRVLPDEEVKAINDAAGTADLPRRSEGFAAGGAAMFEGIHEDLQDEQGNPLELWHGTPSEPFEEFKDAKLGSTRDYGFYGRGHYLTPDRENAEEYTTNEYEKPGTVMGPLHAALKNPYIWDASEQGSHRTLRDLQSMGIMKGQARLEPWDNLQGHHVRPFMDEMQKRGHDGVVMKTGRGVQEIVVFKPSAIKHKDAERFDPNDPNIYHARGGVAK